MRGFQQLGCARVVCDGHGFMRTLRDGFYRLGEPTVDSVLELAHLSAVRLVPSLGAYLS